MDKLVSIRMATPADAKGILEVYAPYVQETAITFEYTVPSLKEFEERIAGTLKDMPYIVCEIDGEIVAYAYASHYHDRAAYQWDCELSIYIKEDSHRAGIGRRFYEMLFAILKEMNYIHAYACIASYHSQSIKFHEAMGFKENAHFQQCGFKNGSWYDVTWMDYRLTGPLQEGDYRKAPAPVKSVHELPAEFIDNLFSTYENELETALQNDIMKCKSFLGLLGIDTE